MEIRLVKIARILLAVLFIFSAISKLISLPFFDGLVAELLIGKDYYNHHGALWYTQVLTRVIISGELVLGIAILQESFLKSIIIPAIQIMLILFTLHLFYEGFRHENGFTDGNCGCFGDVIPMNNLESIIKNVVAMLLAAFVWKYHKDNALYLFKEWSTSILAGLVCLITLWLTIKDYTPHTPEVITPVETTSSSESIEQNTKEQVDSLVNAYEFNQALEVALGDSTFAHQNEGYIERLIEVIEIEKK